jgi:fatty-acyl-CoA synthase
MMGQVAVDYLSTASFARRPALWLKLMSDNGSTVAYSPSFGYDLAARRINGDAATLDLSRWRVAGIGGDMVRADVLAQFAEVLKPAGFDARAFLPSYGMAETTLALSFAPLDTGVQVDVVDRWRMSDERIAVPARDADSERARGFVACGRPLPEHAAEIRDEHGRVLPERHVGRILVKGPSVMAGYFDQPEATRHALDPQGWLDTGDLGYMLNGQLVITGRAKDLIIVNGRNIWPQDLEWAVEELPDVRRGDTAAFSIDGDNDDEDVILLVQCRTTDPEARGALIRAVQGVVQRTAAIECKVKLIEPKGLPQTSSGKLSRSRAKTNYMTGVYGPPVPDLPGAHPRTHLPAAPAG